jgi:hypothetical protein
MERHTQRVMVGHNERWKDIARVMEGRKSDGDIVGA